MNLDAELCWLAVESRDTRFDGQFCTGVVTTGIYCRPSCPARPHRSNLRYFKSAAAAEAAGFRACRRCRPDAVPGSAEWSSGGDVAARAVRLIADGVVDREGVCGLAARLGYTTRHLRRVLTEEMGAGPQQIARTQRTHTARLLLDGTDLRMAEALRDPDAFLSTDPGVRRASARLGRPAGPAELEALSRLWRPWRSYAMAHLWQSLTGSTGGRVGQAVPA